MARPSAPEADIAASTEADTAAAPASDAPASDAALPAARHTAFVALGANLGDPLASLGSAIDALDRLPGTRVVARSSFYRTAPIGYADQPAFVNAVVALETALGAEPLLDALQAIEAAHGRERSFANAPRTLDLDLLLHDDAMVVTARLVVPHPRMHERAFVLVPLAEIAPERVVPGHGRVRDLVRRVTDQPVERL